MIARHSDGNVMGIRIDLHVHTRRYSQCSSIDPERLVRRAVKAKLDGLVITEHHHQWQEADLAELLERTDAPGFLLLAGFEYTSRQGDILIYGLDAARVEEFVQGLLTPAEAVALAHAGGAVCIAAHPTRAGLGFDEAILTLPVDAIEVRSTNLQPHEQRAAISLAGKAGKPAVAASDSHSLNDVGRYATDFDDPIRTMADLHVAIRRGRFRVAPSQSRRMRAL